MNILQSILMGTVQGLSEFLPISSSAHLVFTSNFYKYFKGIEISTHSSQEIFLDIMLHLGTLIAVIIYFRSDIFKIIKALYFGLKKQEYQNTDFKLGIYIIIGTIISTLVAYPLSDYASKLVFNPSFVGFLLVLTGFILLLSDFVSKKVLNKKTLDLKNAILISIAQGLAALPGFSRSGLTIAVGLFSGMTKIEAARFSFLLSIPIILGASMIYPLLEIDFKEAIDYNWTAIIVGTIVSMLVGYLCIKYFMKFLSKFSLSIFGYYCLLVGIFTVIFFIGK